MRHRFLAVLACLLFGAALAAEAKAGTNAHRHGRAHAASRHAAPPRDDPRPQAVESNQVQDWIASDPFNIMMRMGQ